MKRNAIIWVGAVLGMLCMGGAAWAGGTHPKTGEPLADEQTFSYAHFEATNSLDPQLTDNKADQQVVLDLFEGLFNLDGAGQLQPGVATHFDAEADNRLFTFHLRRDAKWSDGRPVRAQDFVYAWRRAVDPDTASPYNWLVQLTRIENVDEIIAGNKPVEALGVYASDDFTMEVRLSESLPYFPLITTNAVMFPAPQWAIDQYGPDWTAPENIVSNGAFTLIEVSPERTVRKRNALYWDNANTVIDKAVMRVLPGVQAREDLLFSGEIDRVDIPPKLYPDYKDRHPDWAASLPTLCTYYFSFNLSDSAPAAFKDVRVRKALSYAVDRQALIDTTLKGGQFPAYTFTPERAANFDAPPSGFTNMDQSTRDHLARQWMGEAGYTPSRPLRFTLLYNTSAAHKEIAQFVADMWQRKLGVEVRLADLEWRTFLKVRGEQNFDMVRNGWCGDYNEASTFLDLMISTSGYNDGKYANPEVDALMKAARVASDPNEKYARVELLLQQDMPIIPLYHYSTTYLINPKLKNWPADNVEQKWYSKNLYKVR